MAEALVIDPKSTAVAILDYMKDSVGGKATQLQRAASVLQGARNAGVLVIYVVGLFREGSPEVNPRNEPLYRAKTAGRLRIEGTPRAEVHPEVAPQPGDVVVIKRRIGAFAMTDMEAVLRGKGIETLVIFGTATSASVITTVRWAVDIDYRLVVLADLCIDKDEEVHRMLIERTLPRLATVVQAREFLESLGKTARA